jgi:hypothetical protein
MGSKEGEKVKGRRGWDGATEWWRGRWRGAQMRGRARHRGQELTDVCAAELMMSRLVKTQWEWTKSGAHFEAVHF